MGGGCHRPCCGSLCGAQLSLQELFCQLNCSLLCCVGFNRNTNCNTATQRCFLPHLRFFDLAKGRSLSKRFKTFKHGAGQVYPVNYSVAWLCCSYFAVVLQFKSTQHSQTPFTGTRAFGSCAPLWLPQQFLEAKLTCGEGT